MTKEVKEILSNSRQRRSSLLNMKFSSDGLTWVKDICQRLETSCNEYADACNKYVHTAGDHFAKIYEEVCDWENQHIVGGPDSALDLKHAIHKVPEEPLVVANDTLTGKLSVCDHKQSTISITDDSDSTTLSSESQSRNHTCVCDGDNKKPILKRDTIHKVPVKSSVVFVDDSLSRKLSVCDHKKPTVSIIDDSDLVTLSSESQARSHTCASDGDNEKPLSTAACSVDSEENNKGTSDTSTMASDTTNSSRDDCNQIFESLHGGWLPAHAVCVRHYDVDGTCQDTVASCRNDCEPAMGPCKLGTCGKFQEKGNSEVSDGSKDFTSSTDNKADGMKDFTSSTDNKLIQNLQAEEFESIMLDDFRDSRDDDLDNEIASISNRANKDASFKKKLKNVFISRKGYKLATKQNKSTNMEIQSNRTSSGPSYLYPSSSQELIESEWVLL